MLEVFKWGSCSTGTDETDFVNAKEAKAKIPQVISSFLSGAQCVNLLPLMQVVIDFYEEKLAWFTGEESQEEE